jgi:hypothetical protein
MAFATGAPVFRSQTIEVSRWLVHNEEHRHTFEFTEELAASWLADADEELRQELPWQFAVCPEHHAPPQSGWRVHGIVLEDVFYVVWLDPDHLVFIDGKFHPKKVGNA